MLDKFHRLSFQSHKNNIHKVVRFVEDLSDYYNINNNYFGNILTALTEAVENAIYHGNNNDSSKQIHIKFDITPEGFVFKVKDEGRGFDQNSVPDPTDELADFSKTEGRGLYIIRSLADDVKFHNDGACIEMLFSVSSITRQMSDDRINTLKNIKNSQNIHKKSDML